MKVVEGDFGKAEESVSLQEAIIGCLKEAELADAMEGQFVMVVNTKERMTFITNEKSASECACLLEVAKGTVMTKYVEGM